MASTSPLNNLTKSIHILKRHSFVILVQYLTPKKRNGRKKKLSPFFRWDACSSCGCYGWKLQNRSSLKYGIKRRIECLPSCDQICKWWPELTSWIMNIHSSDSDWRRLRLYPRLPFVTSLGVDMLLLLLLAWLDFLVFISRVCISEVFFVRIRWVLCHLWAALTV